MRVSAPHRPATALSRAAPVLVRAPAYAMTLVLLLAMVAWPEEHYVEFTGWSASKSFGSFMSEPTAASGIRVEYVEHPDGFTRAHYRDASFSVLARCIEDVFAPLLPR